jgi:hypothetical protein
MKIIGNIDVWKLLMAQKPQVALLTGSRGTGRKVGAYLIAARMTRKTALFLDSLLVGDVAAIRSYISVDNGTKKVVVVTPATSSVAGWNNLLSILEDLPDYAHIWIIDEGRVPNSIYTRCFKYTFETPSQHEIKQMLLARGAFSEDEVESMVTPDTHSMVQALELNSEMLGLSKVSAWITAIQEKSREDLLTSVDGWKESHSKLLRRELESQIEKKSILGADVFNIRYEKLLSGVRILERNPPVVAALAVGLHLLEGA